MLFYRPVVLLTSSDVQGLLGWLVCGLVADWLWLFGSPLVRLSESTYVNKKKGTIKTNFSEGRISRPQQNYCVSS